MLVAHRGASGSHPENTLESFTAAFRAGADAVELDVRLTADGLAVVIHDPEVSRTTDGHGFVHAMSIEEIKELDASGRQDGRAEVPTLVQVLDLASGLGGVMLEVKNIPGEPGYDPVKEGAVDATIEALGGFDGPALVASFNPRSIERCRERAPEVATGFLATAAMDPAVALRYAADAGHEWVLPNAVALEAAGEWFVQQAHESGLLVGTWVVDDSEPMRTFFSWKVDAVATNRPEVGVPIRDEFRVPD